MFKTREAKLFFAATILTEAVKTENSCLPESRDFRSNITKIIKNLIAIATKDKVQSE